jgi:hypothetical protein
MVEVFYEESAQSVSGPEYEAFLINRDSISETVIKWLNERGH